MDKPLGPLNYPFRTQRFLGGLNRNFCYHVRPLHEIEYTAIGSLVQSLGDIIGEQFMGLNLVARKERVDDLKKILSNRMKRSRIQLVVSSKLLQLFFQLIDDLYLFLLN